jgi:hypothetical protein
MADLEAAQQHSAHTPGETSNERQLREAHATLNVHATSSTTGQCVTCGVPGPCGRREGAVAVFSRSKRLPTRRPGASNAETAGTVGDRMPQPAR